MLWIPLTLSLLAATSAPPDARVLLERVAETYRRATSYLFEGVLRMNISRAGMNVPMEMPVMVAASAPHRGRTELRNPMFSTVRISNGEHIWTYVPQMSQYTRAPSPSMTHSDSAGSMAAFAAGTPVFRYFSLASGVRQAGLVREESLELDGTRVVCWVVEADYDVIPGREPTRTVFWIDRARNVVLKESTEVRMAGPPGEDTRMIQTAWFWKARINETLPDSLFTFQPPADVKEVAKIDALEAGTPKGPSTSDSQVGQPAADFTLEDLKGRPVGLANLVGKVVLLDFWASWCRPCRIEMPIIAKLGRELRARGLVVIAVNVGENAAVAGEYIRTTGLDLKVALDEDQKVADRYGAVALPTVVIIDRSGRISAHFVGVRDEQTLRTALRKAGIE